MKMLFFANVFLCGALCALALALSATGAALRNASPTGLPVLGGGLGLAASAFTPLAAWGVTNGVEGFPFWGLQTSLFLESLIPLFFWFGAEALFQDDFRWRPKHLLGAGAALLSLANVVQLPPSGTALFADTPTGHAIVNLFKALNLLFVALGLRATFMGWRADLVPSRVKVRFGVVLAGGSGLFAVVAFDAYDLPKRTLEDTLPLALNTPIALVLLSALAFLAKNPDVLAPWVRRPALSEPFEPPAQEPSPRALAPSNEVLAQKLTESIEKSESFRKEGLTISELAGILKVPEYRLRAHINSELGFRNFNQFLSFHRIELAKRLLVAPNHRHDKVLTIALEVGYASLAPFNKAFREATGLSPSAYRDAHSRFSPLDS